MKINTTLLSIAVLWITAITLTGCSIGPSTDTNDPAAQKSTNPVAALFNPVYASQSYVDYTPAALAAAQSEGNDTAVFFHSKTCGSCAKLDTDFQNNEADLPDDIVVFKADWDDNQALAWELNVASYHTVAYYNQDGTTDNIKGIFSVQEVIDAANAEDAVLSVNWQYRTYDGADIAKSQAEGKDIALFFHSKTCWSCAKLHVSLTSDADALPESLIVYQTDWDDYQAVANTYNVAKYHTVAFIDGTTSTNVTGLFSAQELADASSADIQEKVLGQVGEYKVFTTEALAQAQAEGKDTAVFFHSKTCGSCAKLDADINTNLDNIPWDTVILKADWDENQELAAQYNVAKYHTVTFVDGDINENVKGLFTLEELLAAH